MKKSKKFVLAALVLLAITGLLALAGCKNDTVPEPTRYTVKFETAYGTAPADITMVSGAELTDKDLAIEPEVGDNIFEYWYDKDDDTQKPVEEGYTVTKDVTLVAKWRDRGTVASVTFSPAGGTKFYLGESIKVSLTSEEGATIQYHLGDGSWKDYTADSQIPITGDTTITARAAKEGLKPSAVTSATYTVRKLEGITVTTLPAQTVYSERQSFDPTGMVVTATYDDGTTRTVTGTITTDIRTLTQSAGIGKKVTVSYTEGDTTKEATFTVDVVNVEKPTKLTSYSSPNNTGNDCTYIAFGEWPQTIKADSVTVGESEGKQMGMFTYYLGSDGNWYVKEEENANGSGTAYKYSNGEQAGRYGTSTKWFKVEPIVWRVLTTSYKAPEGGTAGNALLLAEKILTGGINWVTSGSNYMKSYIRQWLNGNSETGETSDYGGDVGFLQTAFTESARKLIIADTTVDNSAASTTDAGNNLTQATDYACANTTDKVFLLSQQEATTSEYGFTAYNAAGQGNTRIRVTTDYAKATGAYQGDSSAGYGGRWWLRSPYYSSVDLARSIGINGDANIYYSVDFTSEGVVPALSISLQ